MGETPIPIEIKLAQKQRLLHIQYTDQRYALPCEYLRVFSPSADVRGHAGRQGTLQLNKQGVNIIAIEPVGNYAIRLVFDDGHQTGIYSWQYLHELSVKQEQNWQDYLQRVQLAKGS